ncbi:hypothetical protein SODALDRAFT_361168 [Sodiomyces alkalinus F11]|uniref:Uncharacterized protein n=1 Tax=Sodiomyces alkalinus (strain CBS 110278 / VKM F-3762 / F11) TaxID=1314773 RepID=A0A3N2PSJ9_SODAK|nr:hypothetical protein SODALDRAFT_361168 [Sodiomyces alkalinus F11]ROT37460.1 hypothetical protein SODALDRAFT_361168 [Sodiomyces alkalinus F11]
MLFAVVFMHELCQTQGRGRTLEVQMLRCISSLIPLNPWQCDDRGLLGHTLSFLIETLLYPSAPVCMTGLSRLQNAVVTGIPGSSICVPRQETFTTDGSVTYKVISLLRVASKSHPDLRRPPLAGITEMLLGDDPGQNVKATLRALSKGYASGIASQLLRVGRTHPFQQTSMSSLSSLLPLTLGPAIVGTHADSHDLPHAAVHKRIASLDSATPASKAIPQVPRRLSLQTQSSLPTLPSTSAEWNKAVSEVKRNYINRRYRACSARCCEILDNVKDVQTAVEPAYLIYLHFYAACSAEMLARPLNPSSPYRVKLLQQARSHYHRASELIRTADESVSRSARSSRSSSAATSRSSQHTPSSSLSSNNSSEVSSCLGSMYSPEDTIVTKLSPPPRPLPRDAPKKRVTFDDSHDKSDSEPNIRPDSPTLGLNCTLHAVKSPAEACSPSDIREQPRSRVLCSLPSTPEPPVEDDGGELSFSFIRERSIHRYCAILSTLRIQLASYLASIDAQLSPSVPATAGLRSRFSFSVPTRAASPEPLTSNDEMRAIQLRSRIERLRAAGWERPRFNARRYEELCDNVLSELSSY